MPLRAKLEIVTAGIVVIDPKVTAECGRAGPGKPHV